MHNPACPTIISPNVAQCPTCGYFAGAPNVRSAADSKEVEALIERYGAARSCAHAGDYLDVLDAFEAAACDSCCVINVDLDFLYHFLRESGSTLYSSYQLGVRGEIRKHATPENDRDRTTTDASLFGSHGSAIRYGALSLDGTGLQSYGPFAMRLRDVAIAERASLLEENSYDFLQKHPFTPGVPLPLGYRATWQDRSWLAVAKLGCRLRKGMLTEEFAGILLYSDGDRATDEFIEVHIFGSFDANAVQAVRGSSTPLAPDDEVLLARVKDVLASSGRGWIDHA
jgi:hypothetical protein